ncbi:MAG: cysteine desulfurase [Candidatus Peregrinibacteria bacterium]
MLDTGKIRRQFPFLKEGIVYLDSAASAQSPESVLKAMDAFARADYANVHRGLYPRADRATEAYESARRTVQRFLNAAESDEIIFTKNATEALNLVARSWGHAHLSEGDAVVLTVLEHHSNVVPWLQLTEERGVEIVWIDIHDDGSLKMKEFSSALRRGNVKMVSVTGQSNVLGVRPALEEIIEKAHAAGALVCVDGAQMIAHRKIDVRKLDCDFFAFSGHKLYGPTGIGVLYGKRSLLASMPPFLGGGRMITDVKHNRFTPADPPQKFEAGTPPIVQAVGLAAAIDWLETFSWDDIEAHESRLLQVATETLAPLPGLRLLGPLGTETSNEQRANEQTSKLVSGCLSFTVDGIHPHDLAHLLGEEGFCLRAGHHCAQTLHERLGIPASTRLSVGLYNTEDEIRSLGTALPPIIKKLRPS